jgi:hypothetical protein
MAGTGIAFGGACSRVNRRFQKLGFCAEAGAGLTGAGATAAGCFGAFAGAWQAQPAAVCASARVGKAMARAAARRMACFIFMVLEVASAFVLPR